jgi:hypothetical protein
MQHNIKNIYWLCIAAFLITQTSCKKDLDRSPLSDLASNDFWSTPSNVNLALTALYRGEIQYAIDAEYNPTDWWSYAGLTFLEMATDNAYDRRGDNSVYNQLTNGALTANNVNLSYYWSFSYARIARCNYFLENIGKADLTAAVRSRMIAEARFIRASQYLYLVSYYGSVPLVTHTLTLDSANTVSKAAVADIENYTESELLAAVADLPTMANLLASEQGRAPRQAVLAFLGRLYLFEKNWQKATDAYKQIIDYNENIIDPNYSSLFDGSNEGSKELIFQTEYLMNTASNGMDLHMNPRMCGGFSLFCPLASMAESYDFSDGSPFSYSNPLYNPNDVGANRDPRFDYNIMYNGSKFKGLTYASHPDSTKALDQTTTNIQATRTGYCIRKYQAEGVSNTALSNSGINLPIIRYAEVLLSYLEAQIQLGNIDQPLLDATINKVRGRASVNMPPVTELDPTSLMAIVKKERRNELAFEGIRLWDLYRWDDAVTVLQGKFYGASFPGSVKLRKAPDNSIDPFSRWYVTTKAFKPGNYPWPVPQSETNINPNLK